MTLVDRESAVNRCAAMHSGCARGAVTVPYGVRRDRDVWCAVTAPCVRRDVCALRDNDLTDIQLPMCAVAAP